MPDFPRPKAEVDYTKVASSVWTYSDRTLTSLRGQPRADLLGEDRSLSEIGYTSSRAALLDELSRMPGMEAHQTPIEGSASFLTTDTYPKTVTLIDTATLPIAGKVHIVEGYLDLSALASGESVTIRQYMKIKPNGTYVLYAEDTLTGPLAQPLLYIVTKPARYGIKLELVMSSAPAANRSFDYQFFVKSVK